MLYLGTTCLRIIAQTTTIDPIWWTNWGVLGGVVFFLAVGITLAVRELWSVIKPRILAWLENAAEVSKKQAEFIDQMKHNESTRIVNDKNNLEVLKKLEHTIHALLDRLKQ